MCEKLTVISERYVDLRSLTNNTWSCCRRNPWVTVGVTILVGIAITTGIIISLNVSESSQDPSKSLISQ